MLTVYRSQAVKGLLNLKCTISARVLTNTSASSLWCKSYQTQFSFRNDMVAWIAKRSDDKDQIFELNALFVGGGWVCGGYYS